MKYVFVSHASRDKHIVESIVNYLEANGINCWLDKRDIPPSADFRKAILNGLQSEDCEAVLLVLSFGASASKDVNKEISIAWDNDKKIIVYKIHKIEFDRRLGVLNYDIRPTQAIDASDDPTAEAHLNVLLETLHQISGSFDEDSRVIYFNKLKDFELNEPFHTNDPDFYGDWGSTLLDFAIKSSSQDINSLEKARDKLEQALALDGSRHDLHGRLAQVLTALGNLKNQSRWYEEARKQFDEAISLCPDNYLFYWNCGKMFASWMSCCPEQKEWLISEGNRYFTRAAEIGEDNDSLFVDWADFLYQASQGEEGLQRGETFSRCCQLYKRAHQLKPGREETAHRWNAVLENWGQELGLDPSAPARYFNVSTGALGEPDDQFLMFVEKMAQAHLSFAWGNMQVAGSNASESESLLASAIEKYNWLLARKKAKAYLNNLGVAYALMASINGEDTMYSRAADCFEHLCANAPGEPAYLYNYGMVLLTRAAASPQENRGHYLDQAGHRFEAAQALGFTGKNVSNRLGMTRKLRAEGKDPSEQYKWNVSALDAFRQGGVCP